MVVREKASLGTWNVYEGLVIWDACLAGGRARAMAVYRKANKGRKGGRKVRYVIPFRGEAKLRAPENRPGEVFCRTPSHELV